MLAALCIGILNAYKKFASTAFGPSIYNSLVVLAMCLLGAASPPGAIRTASGVMIAACLFFIMQFVLARKEFSLYTLNLNYRDPGFRRLLGLAIPTMLSGSIVQINTIIMTRFADQFEGAVTSLRYATTTWQLPYGIFAVAIGSVMLPSLAGIHARGDHKEGRRLLTRSLRSALFLTIPFAALFLVLRQDTIRAIFQWRTDFTDATVNVTSSILKWYCFAIVAQTFVFIINQAFYARHQTRVALLNGLGTLVLNGLLCLVFARWLKMNVDSLSLAYAITSCFSAGFLYFIYRRMFPHDAPRRFWVFLVRSAICTTALLAAVMLLDLLPVEPGSKFLQLAWYAFRCAAGIAVYLAVAGWIKMPEAKAALAKMKAAALKAAALWKKAAGMISRGRGKGG
jgi:putative peptidoglycan lipid II flippase